MKLYQLSLTCQYQQKVETHILHIGTLHLCKAVQLLSKRQEKQYYKNGTFPKDSKITYKIERLENKQNEK